MSLHSAHHIHPQVSSATNLLTRQNVARSLSMCLRTVDEAIAAGDIEIVRIGRAVRIKETALNEFIEARVTRRNPRHEVKARKGRSL